MRRSKSGFGTELERFTRAFPSESVLREQVATLLAKIPGVTGVRITHGTQEFGKDIVFFAQSGLEESALHACVVKNEKISGSASSNSGARNVVNQAEQALDTPYVHMDGNEIFPAKVYIISPHDCPPATIHSVAGKLRQYRNRVEFLVGRDLLDRFKKHWPEFLLFDGDFFGSYLAALKKIVERDAELTNIAFQHAFMSPIPVGLSTRYVRPRFKIILKQFELALKIPADLFDSPVTEATLTARLDVVRILIVMLMNPSFQQALASAAKSEEIRFAANRFQALLPELTAIWRTGLTKIRKMGVSSKLKRELATVHLKSEDVQKEWEGLIGNSQSWCASFEKIIERANSQVVQAGQAPMEWLNKKDVQTYSLVYDVSQLLSSSVVRSKSERTIFLNSDLLDTAKRSLLVTGAAGYGKTSFCRWNTLKDIDDLLAGRSTRVPIYVALHRLSQGPLNSLGDLLKTASNDSAMTEELDSKLLMRRPTRLYLDGLDEIASSERQQQIVEIVRETVERCPNLQVIFTGRDYVSGPWLHWLARVQISEFDNAEIREFVEKWLGNDRKQIDLFYTQLSAAVNLIPLLAVPLLASLILSVYRKTGQLPESKVRLYELFVNLLCGGWDDAKQVQRHGRFGAEIKKQVLTHLAASLHHSKKRECTDHDFRVAMKAVTPKLVNKWPELLEDLLRDGLLLSTGSWYGFAHLSFQEYLAAKELLDSTGDEATLRLQWYLQGDNWWKEVLSFYVGMVQNPTTTERWIRSTIKSVQSKPESSGRATFLLERLLETFTAFELSDTRVELPKPLKY